MADDEKGGAGKIIEGAAAGAVGGAVTGGVPGAALGALAGGGKEAAKALVQFVREGAVPADRRLREATLNEADARELEQHAEQLEALVPALVDHVGNVEGALSDMMAALDAWQRAKRQTADARKRRLLMAALLHGFDPDAYDEGLALRMLATLEELDYPEVRWLA